MKILRVLASAALTVSLFAAAVPAESAATAGGKKPGEPWCC